MPTILKILGIKLDLRHLDRLTSAQPCVYVGNHQHVLDLFVHGTIFPSHAVTVGKRSLRWIPIFGWIYVLAGSVLIDRKNTRSALQKLDGAIELIHKKHGSVWIFAEGTRSRGRGLLPFKKGAFHLAIAAKVPLVSVATSHYHRHLDLNRWHSGTVIVEVLPPLPTADLTDKDVAALTQRAHAQISEKLAEFDKQAPERPSP